MRALADRRTGAEVWLWLIGRGGLISIRCWWLQGCSRRRGMMMSWFERLMYRFGWVRADDLALQKLNAEFAFAKLGRLEPAFEALREDHAVTVDAWARELSVMGARAGRLVDGV